FRFGPDYFIPKPFDPRVLWWVAPAVAEAAMDSGVARRALDVAEYRERLNRRSAGAAYSIMRGAVRAAKRDPKRIVFPEASNPTILRAVHTILDEGIAQPILLGRPARAAGPGRAAPDPQPQAQAAAAGRGLSVRGPGRASGPGRRR